MLRRLVLVEDELTEEVTGSQPHPPDPYLTSTCPSLKCTEAAA